MSVSAQVTRAKHDPELAGEWRRVVSDQGLCGRFLCTVLHGIFGRRVVGVRRVRYCQAIDLDMCAAFRRGLVFGLMFLKAAFFAVEGKSGGPNPATRTLSSEWIDPHVIDATHPAAQHIASMLRTDTEQHSRQAARRENETRRRVKGLEDWEKFRAERLTPL